MEEATGPPVEIWPDVMPAVEVFADLETQWRVGFAGPYGLDYAALPAVLQMHRTPRAQWPGLLADIRVMEAAALRTMRSRDGN